MDIAVTDLVITNICLDMWTYIVHIKLTVGQFSAVMCISDSSLSASCRSSMVQRLVALGAGRPRSDMWRPQTDTGKPPSETGRPPHDSVLPWTASRCNCFHWQASRVAGRHPNVIGRPHRVTGDAPLPRVIGRPLDVAGRPADVARRSSSMTPGGPPTIPGRPPNDTGVSLC